LNLPCAPPSVSAEEQSLPTGLQLTALDPVFREHPHDYIDRLRAEDPVHLDALQREFRG
jgi:hypothetical protein